MKKPSMTLVMLALLCAACDQQSGKSTPTEPEESRVCERKHEDSVSCGWPVYLPDGTRIDEPESV